MNAPLFILGALLLGSAVAVFCFRQVVHCALSLVLCLASLAGIYLYLGAEFVGLAQVLVYVGAVAILIVFALLLTRSVDQVSSRLFTTRGWISLGMAGAVFALLAGALWGGTLFWTSPPQEKTLSVKAIGHELMTRHVLPLEVLGLLLTAALIGAVVLALPTGSGKEPPRHG